MRDIELHSIIRRNVWPNYQRIASALGIPPFPPAGGESLGDEGLYGAPVPRNKLLKLVIMCHYHCLCNFQHLMRRKKCVSPQRRRCWVGNRWRIFSFVTDWFAENRMSEGVPTLRIPWMMSKDTFLRELSLPKPRSIELSKSFHSFWRGTRFARCPSAAPAFVKRLKVQSAEYLMQSKVRHVIRLHVFRWKRSIWSFDILAVVNLNLWIRPASMIGENICYEIAPAVKSTAAQLGHQIQPFWKSAIINGCGYNTTESIFGSFQIFATFEIYDQGCAVGGEPETSPG